MPATVDVKADLDARLARVQGAMAEQGIGTLVVYSRGQHNMLRMDQLFYVTDLRTLGEALLLVPRTGRPRLVLSPVWDAARAREAAGTGEVVAVDSEDVLRTARAQLADLPRPWALAGREIMPLAFADALARELGELADAGTLIPKLGASRTPAELERIERAAAIADLGFQALCDSAHVGMREYELAAEVEAAMQSAGAEDNFGLIGAGSHNIAIRPPTERRLEPGDVIIGEITPCYRGFLAQLCRTLILGEPNETQRTTFDLLIRAEEAGFAVAKPGLPSAGIARAVNEVIGGAGYAEYCRQPYMRTRGHGLGLGGVVPYDVNEDSGPVLERNMTMVIHPNQYVPETGYMMLGDTVAIEAGGPRRLTQTEVRLFSKPAA